MDIFRMMRDHTIAMRKKKHYIEKLKSLEGLFAPKTNLQAHVWIRQEIRVRTNLFQVADQMVSDSQLYKDLDYEPTKRA